MHTKVHELTKFRFLKEGIIKQISYERRDYELVEEKSLSQAMSRITMKKEFRHYERRDYESVEE